MTKEEKLELISKIETQVDGAESYLKQLLMKDDDGYWPYLPIAFGCIHRLRKTLEEYKRSND